MSDAKPSPSRRQRVLDRVYWFALASLILGAGLCLSARWFWLGEALTNFRWQFGFLAGGVGLCLALLGARRRGLAALLLALWSVGPVATLSLGSASQVGARPTLKLMSANVFWANKRYDDILALIGRENPDVLAILEGPLGKREPYDARLREEYPYTAKALDTKAWLEGAWAIKLYSKVEFSSVVLLPFADVTLNERPALEVVVQWQGQAITIQVVHTPRAGRADNNRARDEVLMRLAQREVEGPRILMGDFNLTSFSPAFASILSEGQLRDSRQGFGRLASWTPLGKSAPNSLGSNLRHLELTWITIDHALVSQGLDVIDRRVEPIPGSDHRALILEVASIPGEGD